MYGHSLKSKTRGSPLAAALLHSRVSASAGTLARQKLLVPLDGSYTAESALAHVVKISESARVAVHLLNVQTPLRAGDVTALNSAASITEHRRAVGEQSMMRAKRALDSYGIPYTTQIVFGEPAEEIVRYAEANRCDQIVMATKRRWSIERLVHRSVTQRVVKRTDVPVTIVKSRAASTSPALCLYLDALFAPVRADEHAADDLALTPIG